jgi:hypothetical protein
VPISPRDTTEDRKMPEYETGDEIAAYVDNIADVDSLRRMLVESLTDLMRYTTALRCIAEVEKSVYMRDVHGVLSQHIAQTALAGLYPRMDDTGCIYFSQDHQ